jgi:hypothetical protein
VVEGPFAVVAIFNSNDDVVEMLRLVMEDAGLVVISGHIDAIRRGELSLFDFVRQHDPDVVVWDLVPPYDRSWRFLDHVRGTPDFAGRRFVITSTNRAKTIEAIGDAEDVHEIVGKPYDIGEIARAVTEAARHALAARKDRPRA